MYPLTVPTEAELLLAFAAKDEASKQTDPAEARRGLHTLVALIAVALLGFGYVALSLVLGR